MVVVASSDFSKHLKNEDTYGLKVGYHDNSIRLR